MSEVEEAPEELIEGEASEPSVEADESGEEESIKSTSSSPTELRILVDVIDLVRKVLQGEASEKDLENIYEKLYSKS